MTYTLESRDLIIEISDKGAELQSIHSKIDNTEFLWQSKAPYWTGRAPILFPIVCSLKDGRYNLDGKSYEMPQHGFARRSAFKLIKREKSAAVFELTSNDETKKSFPFDFKLTITYLVINDTVSIEYKVTNLSNNIEMFFNIGTHEAYSCPINDDECFEDYYLEFEPFEGKLMATEITSEGLLEKNQNEILLDNFRLNLDYDIFTKHKTLVFENSPFKSVTLKSIKSKQAICVDFNEPHVGIWTQHQSGGRPPFICIEPWIGLPDEVISNGNIEDKKGIIKLAPNESLVNEHTITILRGEG